MNTEWRDALPRILPFALFVGLMALEPAWPVLASRLPGMAAWLETWSYALRTVIVLGLLLALRSRYQELQGVPAASAAASGTSAWRAWSESAGVGVAVYLVWISVGPMFRIGAGDPVGDMTAPWPDDPVAATMWIGCRLAGSALLVPIIEELFWRSYLMRRINRPDFLALHPAGASLLAVFASSFVFALEHRELLAGLLAGLAYAWVYRRSGDLRQAVVAHAVTNLALGIHVLGTGDYSFW